MNRLERRRDMLADKLTDLSTKGYKLLTDPNPYGQKRISPDEQLNKYLVLEQEGRIGELRRSKGGPFPDEEVDKYSIRMEGLKAQRLSGHTLAQFDGPREYYDEEEDDS